MKSATLFQLGGIAILVAAVLYAIGNIIYFLSGQPQGPIASVLWISFVGDTLLVLGLGGLYARQAHRAGILGLVGYVLLIVGTMFFIGNYAVSLGVTAGILTPDQIAQVPAYSVPSTFMPWLWMAGLIVFGIAIYRAQVLPKYAGALLVLVAILQQLTGWVGFVIPIFAVLSFVVWAWLGYALLMDKGVVSREPVPVM